MDNEECEAGVRCIAVPVKNFSGEVVAGISLSAPVTRLDKQRIEEMVKYLKDISVHASKELGWEG
jgi:DNA-binding IclR family transcriptional regulator